MPEELQTDATVAGGGDIFAPSVDTVEIQFTAPEGKTVTSLYYEVRNSGATVVYKSPTITEGIETLGKLEWDGEINGGNPGESGAGADTSATGGSGAAGGGGTTGGAGGGDAADGAADNAAAGPPKSYATPLDSPYTVQVYGELTEGTGEGGVTPAEVDGSTETAKTCAGCVDTPAEPSGPLKVEYHSIELKVMPWDELYLAASGMGHTGDPNGQADESTVRMWCQYRLHEQGCWAGPVDGSDSETYKKGVRRYKLADPLFNRWLDGDVIYEKKGHDFGREMRLTSAWDLSSQSLETDTTELAKPYEGSTVKRDLFSDLPAFESGGDSKLYIDNHRFFISEFTEFSRDDTAEATTTKFDLEKGWLSRPMIPLKATIYLKGADGERHLVPSSVAGTPLVWTWTDAMDDGKKSELEGSGLIPVLPEPTPDEPSYGAEYIRKLRARLKAAGGFQNATEEAGGILVSDPTAAGGSGGAAAGAGTEEGGAAEEGEPDPATQKNRQAAFAECVLYDGGYTEIPEGICTPATGTIPFVKDGVPSDAGGGSCVYLHTSTLGGDAYKVSVKIDFGKLAGEEDRATMEAAYSGSNFSKETGWLVAWRRTYVAAYVGLPKCPQAEFDEIMAKMKKEFAPGYLEIDYADCQKYAYSELFEGQDADAWKEHWLQLVNDMVGVDTAILDYLGKKDPWDESIWPGDPEAYENPGTFADAFNATIMPDKMNSAVRKLPPAILPNMMAVIEGYAASGNADVEAAAQYYKDALERVLVDSGGEWAIKAMPDKEPIAPYTPADGEPPVTLAMMQTLQEHQPAENSALPGAPEDHLTKTTGSEAFQRSMRVNDIEAALQPLRELVAAKSPLPANPPGVLQAAMMQAIKFWDESDDADIREGGELYIDRLSVIVESDGLGGWKFPDKPNFAPFGRHNSAHEALTPELLARFRALHLAGNADWPAVWTGEDDVYLYSDRFTELFQKAIQLENINAAILALETPDVAPEDLVTSMTLAEEYLKCSEPKIVEAAQFYKSALEKVLDPKAPPEEGWKLKADADLSKIERYPGAAPDGADAATDSTGDADAPDPDALTAAQMAEILLPKAARDEITAWANGDGAVVPKVYAYMVNHQKSVAYAPLDLAPGFQSVFKESAKPVLSGERFKADIPPAIQWRPAELRQFVMVQRVGQLAAAASARIAEAFDRAARVRLSNEPDRVYAVDGMVIMDYRMNDPVDIDERVQQFVVSGAAFGGLNGVAMMDRGLTTKWYSLFAHEMAHCMLMQHSKNAAADRPALFANHDFKDDNCIMSYPTNLLSADYEEEKARKAIQAVSHGIKVISPKEHYCHDKFTPHFCGKCILQLRGWNIRADELLQNSFEPDEEALKAIFVRVIPGDRPDDEIHRKSLETMGISFYPSNKVIAGGTDEISVGYNEFRIETHLVDFPPEFGYSEDAARDPNAFRIEVEDPNHGVSEKITYVTLEALKPDGQPFPDGEREHRALVDVECERLGTTNIFRSRYLRLVTDEEDWKALSENKQGLLVTDMADGEGGENDLLEIIGQQVKVTYDPYHPSKRA